MAVRSGDHDLNEETRRLAFGELVDEAALPDAHALAAQHEGTTVEEWEAALAKGWRPTKVTTVDV